MEGEKILSICERGDKLLGEEVGKVYKGKKISKGETAPEKEKEKEKKKVFQTSICSISFRHISSYDCLPQLLCYPLYPFSVGPGRCSNGPQAGRGGEDPIGCSD